jgi:hypothetical protein
VVECDDDDDQHDRSDPEARYFHSDLLGAEARLYVEFGRKSGQASLISVP